MSRPVQPTKPVPLTREKKLLLVTQLCAQFGEPAILAMARLFTKHGYKFEAVTDTEWRGLRTALSISPEVWGGGVMISST